MARSSSSPTSSSRRAGDLGRDETVEQVAPRSPSPTTSAGDTRSTAPYPSPPATREGPRSGEHTPRERTTEELIAFGGITDPVTVGRCVSNRIQGQPGADDL